MTAPGLLWDTILKWFHLFPAKDKWTHYILQENAFHSLSPKSRHLFSKTHWPPSLWGQSSTLLNQKLFKTDFLSVFRVLAWFGSVMYRHYLPCLPSQLQTSPSLTSPTSCMLLERIHLECGAQGPIDYRTFRKVSVAAVPVFSMFPLYSALAVYLLWNITDSQGLVK